MFSVGFIPENFLGDIFDKVGIINSAYGYNEELDEWSFSASLEIDGDLSIQIPGLENIRILIGANPEIDSTSFILNVAIKYSDHLYVSIQDIDVIVEVQGGSFIKSLAEDPNGEYSVGGKKFKPTEGPVKIYSGKGFELNFSTNGEISIKEPESWSLTPFCIPSAGVGFNITGVKIRLNPDTPLPSSLLNIGLPDDWVGLFFDSLELFFSDDSMLKAAVNGVTFENLAIGRGGFSGRITGQWTPALNTSDGKSFTGSGSGSLFGIPFALQRIVLDIKQNSFIESKVEAAIIFPFFDQPALVDISLTNIGDFVIVLSPNQTALQLLPDQPPPEQNSDGFFVFTKENLMRLTIKGLGFELKEGNFMINISGSIKPLVRGLEWPEFEVESLSIDSQGHVKIDGGWIDLPNQKSFDLYAFLVSITKIGFGNEEDGTKWIGLSGGIKLVDGIPLEGSVEGLKIKWKPPADVGIEIGGIRVAFEIKDVLKFDGSAVFIDEPDKKGFAGGVKMVLYPLDGCSLDVQLLVGKNSSNPPYTFFYTYIGADLPVGIPLFSTGLALYGMAGLFGYNMEPSKGKAGNPNEGWYENPDGTPGWYLRNTPGITDATTKWLDSYESMVFGAGITLGTLSDNGYTFSAKTLLVLLLPGPVIIVEGKANFLKERKELDENPLFRILAVYDSHAGTLLMNLETNYILPENSGEVLKIRALAEAFFDFNNSRNWHLYIGQEDPEEKRVRAEILALFEANAYFMLTGRDVAMGAWVGYDNQWKFGPLRVVLSAWMEGKTKITFKPQQAEGELTLQGDVQLKAFGASAGLNVSAAVQVQTPNPFFVHAEFRVKLNLPWPLPDPKAKVILEWKEESEPPIPITVAKFGIEHLKVTEKWTLERYPEYDGNADGFYDGNQLLEPSGAVQKSPVIPLDARPVIVFAKPVEDGPRIGDNPAAAPPAEKIGEGYEYRYRLQKMFLEKKPKSGIGAWTVVAVKSENSSENVGELYGSWQAVQGNNSQQVNAKLMLWTMSAFEISRELNNSGLYATPIMDAHNPCAIDVRPEYVCVDFENYKPKDALPPVFILDGGVIVYGTVSPQIVDYDAPWFGTTKALVSRGQQPSDRMETTHNTPEALSRMVYMVFPKPVSKVDLYFGKGSSIKIEAFIDEGQGGGTSLGGLSSPVFSNSFSIPSDEADVKSVTIEGTKMMALSMSGTWILCKICYLGSEEAERVANNESLLAHVIETTELHWNQHKDILFEPDAYYKLTVVTEVIRNDTDSFPFIQHTYFQTAKPPGAYMPGTNVGVGLERYPYGGPLKDLSHYIKSTIPKTGQKPVYRAYDIGIIFNESYVDQMYLMAGLPLSVQLFDNNDQPLVDSSGVPIILENKWGDNQQVLLTREEQQWIHTLGKDGCVSLDYKQKTSTRNLYCGQKDMVLKPETLYKAKVVAGSGATAYSVHQFSFIASRYTSFMHQIQSFNDIAWSHGRLIDSGTNPLLSAGDKTILEDILSELSAGNSYQEEIEAKKFEQINQLFKLGLRQLPGSLEILALDDNSGSGGSSIVCHGFLLESPEPFDWKRTSLEIRLVSQGTAPSVPEALEPVKILGASISFSGGGGSEYNNEWVDILIREEFDIRKISLEHMPEGGTGDFQPYTTFTSEYKLPIGTVTRIHSGRKQDDNNPAPELEHRYLETDSWHFSATGENFRIVDLQGRVLHTMNSSPGTTAVSKDVVIIRNSDGTGAFIFFPSSSSGEKAANVDNGNYIFDFSFKTNMGDDHPVLRRRGGLETDEDTQIQFSYPAGLPE